MAGVGVVVGAITGGISMSQASTLKDECPNDVCHADKEEDIDTSMALGHTSTAFFAIAGAGAGVGIIGLLMSGSDSTEESASIRPSVGLGFLGLEGRF